jgi:hypothetical protein
MYGSDGDEQQEEELSIRGQENGELNAYRTDRAEEEDLDPAPLKGGWDQRGKTGLYGGGGRGADDIETGWIQEYAATLAAKRLERGGKDAGGLQRAPGAERKMSLGAQVERAYEQRRADGKNTQPTPRYQTRHERELSSGTDPSLSGPETPLDSTFAAARIRQEALHEQLPQTLKLNPVRDIVKVTLPPATPATTTAKSKKQSLTLPKNRRKSEPVSTRPSKEAFNGSKSTVTTPVTSNFPSIASPKTPNGSSIAAGGRRISLSALLKAAGRSKKAVTISNPILPIGFVESLGIPTNDINPDPTTTSVTLPQLDLGPISFHSTSNNKGPFPSPRKVPRNASGESTNRYSRESAGSRDAASFASDAGQRMNFEEFREQEEMRHDEIERMLAASPPLLPMPTSKSKSNGTSSISHSLQQQRLSASVTSSSARHQSITPNPQGLSTFSAYSNSNASSVLSLDAYIKRASSEVDLSQSSQAHSRLSSSHNRLSSTLSRSQPALVGNGSRSNRISLIPTAGSLAKRPSHDYRNSTLMASATNTTMGNAYRNPLSEPKTGWNPGW